LNERFSGLTAHGILASNESLIALEAQVMDTLLRVMRQVDDRRYWDLHYDGLNYILAQPEFERAERMRQVLDLLSERRTLAELMVGAAADDRPRIIIGGDENPAFPLRECSLVIGRYGGENEVGGVLAVLGPMRMEYDRAVSSVRYLASVLNELLSELYGWKR
jgi:heat-inducible transcriptional repressor